jgi:hypothetical protein
MMLEHGVSVEHLLSKHQALSSNLVPTIKKKVMKKRACLQQLQK